MGTLMPPFFSNYPILTADISYLSVRDAAENTLAHHCVTKQKGQGMNEREQETRHNNRRKKLLNNSATTNLGTKRGSGTLEKRLPVGECDRN